MECSKLKVNKIIKDKREFEIDYYFIIYRDGKRDLIILPSVDSFQIDGINAELSLLLDEIPMSWYKWDYEKSKWDLFYGKEQKKRSFPIPVSL